jgi:acetylornithine deacetylase/succinyl-diaminopimelate desuccinylase-like protein
MAAQRELWPEILKRRDEYVDVVCRLARQPSVSSQGLGIRECAALLREIVRAHGLSAEIMPTSGNPVVFAARRAGDDANTILLYGHYDTQPPEPYEAWASPPFEPTIRDGRIYGRGVGDNKGQFLASLFAIKLLTDLGDLPRVNIKFIFEGEEESGSPSLPAFVEEHRELLRADLFYAPDGPMHLLNRPIAQFGFRGVLQVELEAAGANRDLHSGIWGGPVPNAIWTLVDLLKTMRFPDGRVTVEGFYDRVVPPTPRERALMAEVPFDAEAVKTNLGIAEFAGPRDLSYYEQVMFQPTFNVGGIAGGYTGPGARTAIPSKALAKLECRLAAHQDPDEIFAKIRRHVERYAPGVAVRKLHGTRPSKTSPELPVSRVVVAALGEAYGVPAVVVPLSGGSSPNYLITDVLKIPSIWTTYGPPDENNHAPNENMTIESILNGVRASAVVLRRFAEMPRTDLGRPPHG